MIFKCARVLTMRKEEARMTYEYKPRLSIPGRSEYT